MSYLRASFFLGFVLVFSFAINVHAANASDLMSSREVVGIQPVGEYAKVDLAATAKGTAIPATMIDSPNTEGYADQDLGSQINVGNEEFKVNRVADGGNIGFSSNTENGGAELAQSDAPDQAFSDAQNYVEDLKGRFGVGIIGSYVKYQYGHYNLNGEKVKVRPEYGTWLGMNLTYFVTNYTSFELSVDDTKTDLKFSAPTLPPSSIGGKLAQVPILFAGRLHSDSNGNLTPYFSGGIAYFLNDFHSNTNTIESLYGPGAKIKVDDSFGFFLGTGGEYFFSRNAAFNVDLKYIWDKVKAKVNKPGYTNEYFHINPIVISAGIKYYF